MGYTRLAVCPGLRARIARLAITVLIGHPHGELPPAVVREKRTSRVRFSVACGGLVLRAVTENLGKFNLSETRVLLISDRSIQTS
jgi:hypothetical protein